MRHPHVIVTLVFSVSTMLACGSGASDEHRGSSDTAANDSATSADTASSGDTSVPIDSAAPDIAIADSAGTGLNPDTSIPDDTGSGDTGSGDTGSGDTGNVTAPTDAGTDTHTSGCGGCADPSATCSCDNAPFHEDGTYCVSPIVCNAVTLCPTGYRCDDSGPSKRCICDDLAICGIVCDGAPCPCGMLCNGDNRCVEPPPCAFSETCDPNERCYDGDCVPQIATGTKEAGSECGTGSECLGGSCAFRTCTKRCDHNSDCPSGLICAESDNLENNGCVLPQAASCTDCNAADQTCGLYNGCSVWCAHNSDCTGRCVADTESNAHPAAPFVFYRVCDDASARCPADAFEVDVADSPHPQPEDPRTTYCSKGAGCASDADCPSEYPTCIVSDPHGPAQDQRGTCGAVLSR